jgi:hypothetical protein
MQSPHRPEIVDMSDGTCVVECPQCRKGRASDVPIGIGLRMVDRITAGLLAQNHRDEERRTLAAAGNS